MRSLSEIYAFGLAGRPALAGGATQKSRVLLRGERSARARRLAWLKLEKAPRGLGLTLASLLLASAALVGAVRGGQYQNFLDAQGSPQDFIARQFGLGIAAVTISGQSQLHEQEILRAAGISAKSSLLFFDPAEARRALEAMPLVKSASIRKLYPDQVIVEIVERTPYALWQEDGQVHTVAKDGTPIDEMRDQRFIALPFVVGKGANEHLGEFSALLEAAGDLRPRIAAGVYIGERRWNLKMASGLDIKLPEADAAGAVAALAKLQHETHILDRDVLSLDFRVEGRVFARLSEEAAAARAGLEHPKKKAAL